MVGRFPDYDVLEQMAEWDEATQRTIRERMAVSGPLRFFSEAEEPGLRALCDTAMAQDGEPRVPVAELVDDKLAAGRLDGYQFADMPDDRQTWRLVLRGLDEVASRDAGTGGFASCDTEMREAIVHRLAAGRLEGGVWDDLDVTRAWSVCMRAILEAFYSHPWAWNEIGFGGPAYPRGYMRLGPLSTIEPYERPGATDEDPVAIADLLQD